MPEVLLIVAIGTILLLLLGMFITSMTMAYQRKRLEHREEVQGLTEAFQKEVLKAQIEMQEQTFLSISQEIHDNIGQILAVARLNISTLAPSQPTAFEQKIISTKELLDQAIEDLRSLSKRLNSKYATRQSLTTLLEFQLDLIQKTGALETSFEVKGQEKGLDPEKKLIIFRIAQEALNNVLRHAEASTVKAQLQFSNQKITLRISDDGKGFTSQEATTPDSQTNGTGTHNMLYRAELIGANLRIKGTPGSGTFVFLELPLTD